MNQQHFHIVLKSHEYLPHAVSPTPSQQNPSVPGKLASAVDCEWQYESFLERFLEKFMWSTKHLLIVTNSFEYFICTKSFEFIFFRPYHVIVIVSFFIIKILIDINYTMNNNTKYFTIEMIIILMIFLEIKKENLRNSLTSEKLWIWNSEEICWIFSTHLKTKFW